MAGFPTSVKSRLGYVITIAGCPFVWKSRLIPEITLSTTETEYTGLSIAMRTLFPVLYLVEFTSKTLGLTYEQLTSIETTVWEDNAGALTLANRKPGQSTPRSKHYAIKYHWFRHKLKKTANGICDIFVKQIPTKLQKADLLTKGLTKDIFTRLRKLLCGW